MNYRCQWCIASIFHWEILSRRNAHRYQLATSLSQDFFIAIVPGLPASKMLPALSLIEIIKRNESSGDDALEEMKDA